MKATPNKSLPAESKTEVQYRHASTPQADQEEMVDTAFVTFKKRPKPIRPQNEKAKKKKLLMTSKFVEDEKDKNTGENLGFEVFRDFLADKNKQKKYPMNTTQRDRLSEIMSPHNYKDVEVLTYRLVKIANQFEEMWKAHGTVKWHSVMYAFMIAELNALADKLAVVQRPKRWPVVYKIKGIDNNGG